ncbi:ribosomal S3 (mitochondrion) protein [Rutstroemia sp. NJR-2017a WRK4]|nr:ribosomal S3 (mitochondrion) protein [Rutstroemia sp. NJR-2017a WRK4]
MDYKNDKIKIIPCAFFRPGVMQGQAYYLNPVRSKKLLRGKELLIFNKKQKKHIKVIPLTVKTSKQKISIRKRSRSRGLSAKKIFVAKGGLKHTSTKAVITLYLYNTEKKFLIRNLKKQIFQLYRPNKGLKRQINLDRNQKVIVSYNRPFSLKEYLLRHDHYTDYITSFKMSFVEKLCKYFNLTNKYINLISNLVESKGLSEEEKLLIFLACGEKVYSFYTIKYPNYQDYMHKVKLHYLNKLTLYLKLLILNQIKFKHAFLLELRYLVSEIYNKNVEFNLVNLKKMHLNSDIFTQAVSLKLKNRNNRLYKVLISSLSKVKLPNVNRIKEKYNKSNKEQLLINKMRNLKINSLTKDSLNKLLLKNFPFFNTIKAHLAFSPLPPQLVEVEQGRMGRSYVERNQNTQCFTLKTVTELLGLKVE